MTRMDRFTQRTPRWLWLPFLIALVLVAFADRFVEAHPHFGVDATIGFGAWFGILACVALLIAAGLVGLVLQRPDTYYDD